MKPVNSADLLSDDMVQKFEQLAKLIKTKEEYNKWIKFLNKNIRSFNKIRKNEKTHKYSKLESNLALLCYYREKFRNEYHKKIKRNKLRNLMWTDIDSCFQGRIKTGAIINLNLKDPNLFFIRQPNIKEDIVFNTLYVYILCMYVCM